MEDFNQFDNKQDLEQKWKLNPENNAVIFKTSGKCRRRPETRGGEPKKKPANSGRARSPALYQKARWGGLLVSHRIFTYYTVLNDISVSRIEPRQSNQQRSQWYECEYKQ